MLLTAAYAPTTITMVTQTRHNVTFYVIYLVKATIMVLIM
jgi:hypothetical protein